MSLPILTLVFDRKKTATKTKAGMLELKITYNKVRKYLSTGVKLLPKEWKDGRVVRREDCAEVQEGIELLVRNVRKVLNAMMDEGCVNLDEIKVRMDEMTDGKKNSFIDYIQRRTEVRKYGKSADTCERYDRFFKFMVEWGGIVSFRDVTDAKVIALDKHLKGKGMKNYSKWNNYHRFLNSFIIDAMDDGLLKRNPYKWLHIQKDKTKGIKKYLTQEEFGRMKRVALPTNCLEKVRDLFIFQTYTCMSYVDLASFDAEKVENNVYTGVRVKTGKEFTFVLLRPAREILEKYGGKLPIISNVKYDAYLKIVAQAAGIDKPISSHWARHTGATMMLNDGNIDMEIIAKILGHASTRQTRETYAALLDTTIADSMEEYDKKL